MKSKWRKNKGNKITSQGIPKIYIIRLCPLLQGAINLALRNRSRFLIVIANVF